ncbi:hypothetical protein EDM80_11885 [bacterium]|nr:MAG: hypothetical protein EDM80_11885 [bacterium]
MSDRDKLERILETRAAGDFQSMTDAELSAFCADAARELGNMTRPASEHDPRNPEHVMRARTGAALFQRLLAAGLERERRIARGM